MIINIIFWHVVSMFLFHVFQIKIMTRGIAKKLRSVNLRNMLKRRKREMTRGMEIWREGGEIRRWSTESDWIDEVVTRTDRWVDGWTDGVEEWRERTEVEERQIEQRNDGWEGTDTTWHRCVGKWITYDKMESESLLKKRSRAEVEEVTTRNPHSPL